MVTMANPEPDAATAARKRRIEMLARATLAELEAVLDGLSDVPEAEMVRGPETGLVMVRGRMGGTGNVFNLGEATATRATVRLENGVIGHGYRLGGDRAATRASAILDALGEVDAWRGSVADFVGQIAARVAAEDAKLAEETAATRVDFFTMVRGDD